MKDKKIVLFDLDGTLTEPRGPLESSMIDSLKELRRNSFEIGIVTGSDLDYLIEQCQSLFSTKHDYLRSSIHYMPCNGTKYYRSPDSIKEGEPKMIPVYENNMRSHIGEDKFRQLMKIILSNQNTLSSSVNALTGHFVNYRGSMINWCPIGRNASKEEREKFVEFDKKHNLRNHYIKTMKKQLGFEDSLSKNIVVKLGGESSFDIYPKGWDKTYAFQKFSNYEEIYFVGDRCGINGNDREAYIKAGKRGYETKGPEDTRRIISEICSGTNSLLDNADKK